MSVERAGEGDGMNFHVLADGYHIEGLCPDGDALWFSDVFVGGLRRRSADGRQL